MRIHWIPLAAAIAVLSCASQATTVLTLDPPGGTIFGQPGQTVGWGFTLENDTGFLVVSDSVFVPASSLGQYQDFIGAFNFIVVGPLPESTSVQQSFDPVAHTGVGAMIIDPNAPLSQSVAGQIVVHYDLFSRSPNDPGFNPDTDLISSGQTLAAEARVEIVPEPTSLFLGGCGLLVLGYRLRRRRWGCVRR